MIEGWTAAGLAALVSALQRIWPSTVKRKRKGLLKRLLQDKEYSGGRSFEVLQRKSGASPDECRKLLSELGAEGIKLRDGREGWRLAPLVLVLLGAAWLGSHYQTAIAQNPGDSFTAIQRPTIGGSALSLPMPDGRATPVKRQTHMSITRSHSP